MGSPRKPCRDGPQGESRGQSHRAQVRAGTREQPENSAYFPSLQINGFVPADQSETVVGYYLELSSHLSSALHFHDQLILQGDFLQVQTGPGKSDAVAEAIANLEEAHYVAITTGAYDVFIWAGLESAESLGTFLRTKIGVIEGVQRTETFVNLAIKKRTYGLVL